jgi:hypothetical protein
VIEVAPRRNTERGQARAEERGPARAGERRGERAGATASMAPPPGKGKAGILSTIKARPKAGRK